jgi:hypothetical protein
MTPLLFFASLVAVAPPIVIQSARIEVGNGQVIPVGNIVIQDDKIVAVGPDVQVPAGATVINGAGLTVYPGFIDAYSTSGLKLPTPLASGTKQPDTRNTAPATMWKENRRGNRADVKAVMHLDLKAPYGDRHENGVTSLLLSSGDGTISGMAGIVNLGAEPKVLSGEVATEINFRSSGGFRGGDEMAGGQGRQQAPAADPGYTYPQTPFGVFALLRQTLYDAKTYAAKTPSKADPSYEGLKPLVTGKVPALYTIANSRDIARAARYAEEFGYKFIVNGGIDTYRMIPTLKKHSVQHPKLTAHWGRKNQTLLTNWMWHDPVLVDVAGRRKVGAIRITREAYEATPKDELVKLMARAAGEASDCCETRRKKAKLR